MEICEEFLDSFRLNTFTGWKSELASTFSNFKSIKVYGNNYDFGDFDKCINFHNGEIYGKYCSVQYYSTSSDVVPVMPKASFFNQGWKNLDTRFGGAVCIPSICDSNSLIPQLMDIVLNGTNYVMSSDYIQEDFCQVKKNFGFTASGIFGIFFVLFFLLLAVVSTIKSQRDKQSIYSCFSLIQNVKNLFQDESNDKSTAYLRGLKTIGFLITGFIHMILAALYYPSTNPQQILAYHKGSYKIVVSQGPAGASMCIMISSFLLTKALWKMLDLKRLNIPLLYIYRYFRIVPLLFFVMVVEKFIMFEWISTVYNAPFFFSNQFSYIFKYYWLPLLQVQNYFVDIKESFTPAAYYFAVDFHLFIATPFVVYLIWRWKRTRIAIFLSILTLSFYINYSYIMEHFEFFRDMKYLSYEEKILSRYVQETQFSLQAWIIGIFFGYFTSTHQTLHIGSKTKKFFLWIALFYATAFWVLRPEFEFFKKYIIYMMPFDKLYQSIIFLLMLFLGHYGPKDIITQFLSLKLWIPLDRLGLTYLIAHALQYRWMITMRHTPFEYTLSSIFQYYLYGTAIAFAYGLVLNLLVEQPIVNLFKFLFRASREAKKKL